MAVDGIAMVVKSLRSEHIHRLLVSVVTDIPGSDWGVVEGLTMDFLRSGVARQVLKINLNDAQGIRNSMRA